jgi:hypothetical protein
MKMKTKNQTEHPLLELAATKAANEDGISPATSREATSPARKQSWSPLEVWRTRIKVPAALSRAETAQNPR